MSRGRRGRGRRGERGAPRPAADLGRLGVDAGDALRLPDVAPYLSVDPLELNGAKRRGGGGEDRSGDGVNQIG